MEKRRKKRIKKLTFKQKWRRFNERYPRFKLYVFFCIFGIAILILIMRTLNLVGRTG